MGSYQGAIAGASLRERGKVWIRDRATSHQQKPLSELPDMFLTGVVLLYRPASGCERVSNQLSDRFYYHICVIIFFKLNHTSYVENESFS